MQTDKLRHIDKKVGRFIEWTDIERLNTLCLYVCTYFPKYIFIHISGSLYNFFFRVDAADNLFDMSETAVKSFSPFKQIKRLCSCEENSSSSYLTEEILCTNKDAGICDPDTKPIQADICFAKHERRRRSPFTYEPSNVSPRKNVVKVLVY